MKKYLTYKNLPWAVTAAGLLGLALYLWLMATENEKGFVAMGHISAVLLVVLTLAVVAALYMLTRRLTQANKYRFNFPASTVGAVGALAAGAGVLYTSAMELLAAENFLETAASAVGVAAALVLFFLAHCRKNGRHPNVLAHTVVCIYMMLRLICMYRAWSADPQIFDYCFRLLAIVCAMLAVYHRACFDADCGKRPAYTFYNLLTVYFCVISLYGSGRLLYLSLGCWLFTDLCDLTPMPATAAEDANEAQ